MNAFITGFGVGLSLIMAIGSQNAFVLRQGIRGEHVNIVCLACALSDAIMIIFGVTGFQMVLARAEWLGPVFLYAGVAFLFVYGCISLRSAVVAKTALAPASGGVGAALGPTLGVCMALTWLNPHVYLDTMVLLGAVSTRFPGDGVSFASGAVTASFLFFFTLGHGAALLRPVFAKPGAWRVLDVLVALMVWSVALSLLLTS